MTSLISLTWDGNALLTTSCPQAYPFPLFGPSISYLSHIHRPRRKIKEKLWKMLLLYKYKQRNLKHTHTLKFHLHTPTLHPPNKTQLHILIIPIIKKFITSEIKIQWSSIMPSGSRLGSNHIKSLDIFQTEQILSAKRLKLWGSNPGSITLSVRLWASSIILLCLNIFAIKKGRISAPKVLCEN